MPQVFEFHFNPKLKPDLIFDSFCYEPENIYERRLGNLYLVGLLKNVLPQNLHFLDKLAKIIEKEYYRSTVRKPEKALKEALKEANEFLEQLSKKGDVSWLGNLSFTALSLIPHQKFGGKELNFAKVGDLKIFLLRGKKIIDIDRKLKFEEITPWPLKIFGNIVSGKLAEGDILLISTKEVTDFFERENLLAEIASPQQVGEGRPIDEKKLREIFDKRKEEILKISGISLFIVLTEGLASGKKEIISPESYPKEFNLKEIFTPYLKNLGAAFKKIKLLDLPRSKLLGKLKRPEIKPLKIKLLKFSATKFLMRDKKLILILALVFFLGLGFFISQLQEKKELKELQITLEEIQKKASQAESLLILKTPQTEKEANSLLKESLEEISQLVKIISNLPKDFQNRVFSLKDKISKALFELNKLETIEEPELFLEFDAHEFIPQKMVFFKNEFYFFSPYSQNLFKIDKNGQAKIIEINQKFNLAAPLENSILFLTKPAQLTILRGDEIFSFSLPEPYPNFNFDSFFTFRSHLYFLDKNSGEIIKYPYLGEFKWGNGQLWLSPKEEKAIQAKSLAIDDGSLWLLNDNNSLSRYHSGRLQEKIVPEIFPEPKELKKIFTSTTLPEIYLLEPIQKRIIILSKTGRVVKQFQSQKFDNLIDFSMSDDGKTIWLLNGLKVYQLNFQLP